MTIELSGRLRLLIPASLVTSLAFSAVAAAATSVVISEYGGCRMNSTSGLNPCTASSTAGNDEFVELYNGTASPVNISGWSIQRRSASGTGSCWAVLPAAQSIAAHRYYLVAGAGYDASRYPGGALADFASAGATITGGSESLVLFSTSGCSNPLDVVDSVSFGSITDSFAGLRLPAIPGSAIANGSTAERKACADSTASSDSLTGMLSPGGHASQGNARSTGASDADWILRPSPDPQNSASIAETPSYACSPPEVPLLPASGVYLLSLLTVAAGALTLRRRRIAPVA